jgi:HlyD family secretion protein
MMTMSGRKLWIYGGIAALLVMTIVFITRQGAALEVMTAATGRIEQAVEDTGTVKSRQSRTVYVESSGRIIEILVEKGDLIKQGDLLLKLDPTERRMAEISVAQARNKYDLTCKDWQKTQKLYAVGAISRKEYETAETDLKNSAEAYQAAALELDKSTRSTLLRAPRAGIVLDKLVEPNLYTSEGTAAFVIGDLSDLEIEAEILADDAVNIRRGNPVVISGKATGADVLKGRVTKIAPLAKNVVSSLGINQKRRTVTIALTEGNGGLKPGVDIDVKIITITKQDSLKVPLAGRVFLR